MKKKDTLYTVNKFNKPMFAKGVDRENNNVFDGWRMSSMVRVPTSSSVLDNYNISNGLSPKYEALNTTSLPYYNWMSPKQKSDFVVSNLETNPYKGSISETISNYENKNKHSGMNLGSGKNWLSALPGVGSGVTSGFQDRPEYSADAGNGFGFVDSLLANKRKSKVGTSLVNSGASVMNAGLTSGNGAMALAGGIMGTVGTGINYLFGSNLNYPNIERIEREINETRNLGNTLAGFKNNNTINDVWGNINTNIGVSDIGDDGVLAHEAADTEYKLNRGAADAADFAFSGLITGIKNADKLNDERAQFNSAAFGGQFYNNNNMGAIDYGFMQDYLTMKNKQAEARNKLGGIASVPNTLAYGGIEIKHPGRLTELKKRTGKTEAELWAEGRPEVRKMITFARNSRRWSKYALGGYLEGNVYDIPEEEVNRLIAAGYEVEYL